MGVHVIRIAALLAALCFGSSAEAKYTTPLKVGNWSGGAWADDATGVFSNCGLGVSYQNGAGLTYILRSDLTMVAVVSDPKLQLTPKQAFQAKLSFDTTEYPGEALAFSATMAQVTLPTLDNDYTVMRSAKRMGFAFPGLSGGFDVAGIDQVLPSLFACALAERARMATPTKLKDKLDEAVVAGLAAAARIGDPDIIHFNAQNRPIKNPEHLALWGHPGYAGPDGPGNVLAAILLRLDKTPDEMIAFARTALTGACPDGKAQISTLPTPAGRTPVLGLGIVCPGKGSYEEVYFLPGREGGAMNLQLMGKSANIRTVQALGEKYRTALAAVLP